MSGLKIGDIVMVGGAASAEDRAKNAGRFRTVIGFVPAGFAYKDSKGVDCHRVRHSVELDGNLYSLLTPSTEWSLSPYKSKEHLVKINPSGDEDFEIEDACIKTTHQQPEPA